MDLYLFIHSFENRANKLGLIEMLILVQFSPGQKNEMKSRWTPHTHTIHKYEWNYFWKTWFACPVIHHTHTQYRKTKQNKWIDRYFWLIFLSNQSMDSIISIWNGDYFVCVFLSLFFEFFSSIFHSGNTQNQHWMNEWWLQCKMSIFFSFFPITILTMMCNHIFNLPIWFGYFMLF